MPSFKIKDTVTLGPDWVDSTKFNSKDRIVDSNGSKIKAEYSGRRYQLVEKKERQFTRMERFGRICRGIFVLFYSGGTAWGRKSTRNLFTKKKAVIRFGIPQDGPLNSPLPGPVLPKKEVISPVRYLAGPQIFNSGMDAAAEKGVLENFLKNLRKEGVLVSRTEFNRAHTKDEISRMYIQKQGGPIDRFLGKGFVEKVIADNQLRHIKVPKKVAVFEEKGPHLSIFIAAGGLPAPKTGQLTIYAEKVTRSSRHLALDEAIEFMIALEETGYNDFWGENFIIADDGIYFIDTKFRSFTPGDPQFGSILSTIRDRLDESNKGAFLDEFNRRRAAFAAKPSVPFRSPSSQGHLDFEWKTL